jgi:uncharacterized protein involved in exopolysaccharide biosynthesis
VAVSVWLFVTLCATVITFILPESYRATTRVRVAGENWIENRNARFPGGPYAQSLYDPYFIQTEFVLLQSEVILGPVVDRLKLDERWATRYFAGPKSSRAQAMVILKSHLDLRPVRNVSMIEIGVWSERPDEAAEIANAIAEEFRAYHIKQHDRLVSQSRETLQRSIEEQTAKISAGKDSLDRLRKELGITDEKARQALDSVSGPASERPYWDKRRELDELLRSRAILEAELKMEEQINRMSPSLVEIVDRAVPPFRPARPNKPLNIALGMIAGAVLGLFAGLATWVISRLIRRTRPTVA